MRFKFEKEFFIVLAIILALNALDLYLGKMEKNKAYIEAGLSEYNPKTGKLERVRPLTTETIFQHGVRSEKEE